MTKLTSLAATLVTLVTLVTDPATATAASVSGFSADETQYLLDVDRVCTPMPSRGDLQDHRCVRPGTEAVLRAGFRPGRTVTGRRARFAAEVRGHVLVILELRAPGVPPAVLAELRSLDPLMRVIGMSASQTGKLLAIEYECRTAGRMRIDTVVIAVPGMIEETKSTGTMAAEAVFQDTKVIIAKLKRARRLVGKKKYKRAQALFAEVLEQRPDHPQALYGVAQCEAGLRKLPQAVVALSRLAVSADARVDRWRVEARYDPLFRALLADPAFRLAVGLSGDAPSSTYLRVLGHGGNWEQAAVACERPEVRLSLKRDPVREKPKFALVLRSECAGLGDTTRLHGRWNVAAAGLILHFPNPDGNTEKMICSVKKCDDGEDCLTCEANQELQFTLQSVRR